MAQQLGHRDAVKLFEAYKVLTKRELEARLEVNFEAYNKTINIEAQTMVLMANRYILPAALGYLTQVAQAVTAGKAAGVQSKEAKKLLTTLTKLVDTFKVRTEALIKAVAHEGNGDSHRHAKYMRDKIVPAMIGLRETGDALESLVPSSDWPLPTYREMLFIK